MLLGTLTILLIVSLWTLLVLTKHLLTRLSYSHIPGPPAVSFISGHVTCLLETMRREGTSYSLRIKWSVQYPELYLIWLFNTPQVKDFLELK